MPENVHDLGRQILGLATLRNDESFIISQKKILSNQIDSGTSKSIGRKSHLSRMDQKLIELSGYFVVNDEFNFGSEEDV